MYVLASSVPISTSYLCFTSSKNNSSTLKLLVSLSNNLFIIIGYFFTKTL